MNKISTGHDFEIDECIEDAAYLARNRILDTYPDVQTVHFWINQKTQRIRCEIALSKTGAEHNGRPSTDAIAGIIHKILTPTLGSKKKIPSPIIIFNVGVPTDISPIAPGLIDILAAKVQALLQSLPPSSRSNGNNASKN